MGLAVESARGDALSSIDMLARIVALMRQARDGGWEIACFQTGDFAGRSYFRVEFQHKPAPDFRTKPAKSPSPQSEAKPSAGKDSA